MSSSGSIGLTPAGDRSTVPLERVLRPCPLLDALEGVRSLVGLGGILDLLSTVHDLEAQNGELTREQLVAANQQFESMEAALARKVMMELRRSWANEYRRLSRRLPHDTAGKTLILMDNPCCKRKASGDHMARMKEVEDAANILAKDPSFVIRLQIDKDKYPNIRQLDGSFLKEVCECGKRRRVLKCVDRGLLVR